jgi:hypothetical protein
VTYKNSRRGRAGRIHARREATKTREIEAAVNAASAKWNQTHPILDHTAMLRSRFDESGMREIHEIGLRPKQPTIVIPVFTRNHPFQFEPTSTQAMREQIVMRAVPWTCGMNDTQVRWYTWEPIDRTMIAVSYPGLRKFMAYLNIFADFTMRRLCEIPSLRIAAMEGRRHMSVMIDEREEIYLKDVIGFIQTEIGTILGQLPTNQGLRDARSEIRA